MAFDLTEEFKRVINIFVDDMEEGRTKNNPFQPELSCISFGIYEGGDFRYTDENGQTVYERVTASFDEKENKIIKTEKMVIIDLPEKDLSLIVKHHIDLEPVLKLIKSYDHYTGAIENGEQYRVAIKNNENILKELKELGVYEIIFKNLALMFSKPTDHSFNIYIK